MTRRILLRTIAASSLCLVLAGCGEGLPTGLLAGEPDGAFRMERERYDLVRKDGYWEGTIGYTWENRTGGDVFLVNCNGGFALHLERWNGSGWTPAWGPALPDCLSAPIVIAGGERRSFTLQVLGADPGSNWAPAFDRKDPAGWYRLVWTAALSSFDGSTYPFGEAIDAEHRTSSPFRIRTR